MCLEMELKFYNLFQENNSSRAEIARNDPDWWWNRGPDQGLTSPRLDPGHPDMALVGPCVSSLIWDS